MKYYIANIDNNICISWTENNTIAYRRAKWYEIYFYFAFDYYARTVILNNLITPKKPKKYISGVV